MLDNRVLNPIGLYVGLDGLPLDGGYIYIGEAGRDAEAYTETVYWDNDLTVAADQPLRSIAGMVDRSGAPATFYKMGDYSIKVKDAGGVQVFSVLNARDVSVITFAGWDVIDAAPSSLESGTIVVDAEAGRSYQVTSSGGDITTDGGLRLFDLGRRTATAAQVAAALPDGSVTVLDGFQYKTDSTATGTGSATNDLGVDGLAPFGTPVPQHFGAAGDGATDDTTAVQAAANFAYAAATFVDGAPGSTYLVSDTIWFGSLNAQSSPKGFRANGSKILSHVQGGPIIDLVGVKNANLTDWDFDFEADSDYECTYAVVFGRPKQASGVVSSGKFSLTVNGEAYATCAAVGILSSESGEVQGSIVNNIGPALAMCDRDWFEDTFTLPIDNISGTFDLGETISGGGASATLIFYEESEALMFCRAISGTFSDNQAITGGDSGATANANVPSGYTLAPTASPNVPLGIESSSTSVVCKTNRLLLRNDASSKLMPAMIIRGFGHIHTDQINVTHVGQGDLISVGGSIVGPTFLSPFLHATHRNSIVWGDPSESSNVIYMPRVADCQRAGSPSLRHYSHGGVRMLGAHLDVDKDSTFDGTLEDNCLLDCRGDTVSSTLTINSTVEGTIRKSETTDLVFGVSIAQNRAQIVDGYLGITSGGVVRDSVTLDADGVCTVESQFINVTPNTGTSDAIERFDFTNLGYSPNGLVFFVKSNSASNTITFNQGQASTGGSDTGTRGAGDVILSNLYYHAFVYEATGDRVVSLGAVLANAETENLGWANLTGSSTKDASGLATSSVTTEELAEVVRGLIDALISSRILQE